MRNIKTKIISAGLTVALALTAGSGWSATAATDASYSTEDHVRPSYETAESGISKVETVYVNLSASGEVSKVNVTDHIHSEMPQVRVEDVSSLKDIEDVKTFIEPEKSGGYLYWNMESTDLYYTGTTTQAPPLDIKISYYLDGEEISADDIAGKSGRISIKISAENLLQKSYYGYNVHCPMIMLGGMIIPEDSFFNVEAENGFVLGDGAHQIVVFAGLPGMNESLGTDKLGLPLINEGIGDGEYSVSFDTENFSLGNMMFAAAPFSSINALGGEVTIDGIESVKTVLGDLENVMNAFASLDLSRLIQMLYGDAEQMSSLINAVGDASRLYEENKELIALMDKYMTEENLNTLEHFLGGVDKIQESCPIVDAQIELLEQFLEIASKLSICMGNDKCLVCDAVKLLELVKELRSDLKAEEVQESLENMPETVESLRNLIDVMRDNKEVLDNVGELFEGENMAQMQTILNTAAKYSQLDSLNRAQSQHLAARMRAWLAFGEDYDIFTQRTENVLSTVMFVYKTDAIKTEQ